MKKYAFILSLLTFVGCSKNESERVFDLSASERIAQSMKTYEELLVSAQNGWLVEYYPSVTDYKYGGYTYTWQFTPTDVTAILDVKGNTPQTSAYQIMSSAGIYLSFDQHNENLHYFSSPSSTAPSGREGDYEFLFVSHSENEILLRGKKYNTYARLTRLAEPASDYMEKALKIKNSLEGWQIKNAFVGTKEVTLTLQNRNLSFVEDTEQSPKYPYFYTDKGIRFRTPIVVGDTKVEELIFDDSQPENRFWAGSDFSFTLYNKPPMDFNESRAWRFNASAASAASLAVRNKFNETKATQSLGNFISFQYSWLTVTRNGVGEAYRVNYYGSKTDADELHMEAALVGNPLIIKDFILEKSPYKVEKGTRANTFKLTSKADSSVWFILSK